MNIKLLSTLCLAGLLAPLIGCNQVNRMYKQDTGEMAAVPGPPAADATDPQPTPGEQVEFVDGEDAGAEDAMLSAETDVIEPLPEPEPEPATPRTYTIKKGDRYWTIAKEVYGDPMRAKDIEAANPDVDPKKLQIGDEIVLPE